jgi:hypothetical protein
MEGDVKKKERPSPNELVLLPSGVHPRSWIDFASALSDVGSAD